MIDYDSLAGEYHRHRRANGAVLKDLLDGSGITAASRILEIGCGTGNYMLALSEAAGCRCWGIDPSERMLAHADGETHPRLTFRFRRGAAEEIDFPASFFDFIFSVDVIHHLTDRLVYFRRARRQLSPTGSLCTVTDSEEIIRTREPLSRFFPETVEVELGRYPAIERLREEMRAAGF